MKKWDANLFDPGCVICNYWWLILLIHCMCYVTIPSLHVSRDYTRTTLAMICGLSCMPSHLLFMSNISVNEQAIL